MKPYYEEDGITIYHGDCREIAPILAFDVLITDPPYGVQFAGKATKHSKATGGYDSQDDATVGPEVARMLIPLATRAAIFSGIRLLRDYPEPRDIGCIFCPSGAGRGRWGFTLWNPILFYGKKPGACTPCGFQSFERSERNGHPCPKPIEWMNWAVGHTSLPGEMVIDPFCGSGTTLCAAKNSGRLAIGIDRSERYCEIAAERLSQRVLPLVETL